MHEHVIRSVQKTNSQLVSRFGYSVSHRRKGREGIGTPGGTFSAITTSWPRSPCPGLLTTRGCYVSHSRPGGEGIGTPGGTLSAMTTSLPRSPRGGDLHATGARRGGGTTAESDMLGCTVRPNGEDDGAALWRRPCGARRGRWCGRTDGMMEQVVEGRSHGEGRLHGEVAC
jgi:hypothetical protein